HTPPGLGAPVDPRPPRPIRRRTNINLAAPRASRCSTGPGGLYDAEPQARSNGAHSSWRSLKPRRDVRTSRRSVMRNLDMTPTPVRVLVSLAAISIAATSIVAALMVAPDVAVATGAG